MSAGLAQGQFQVDFRPRIEAVRQCLASDFGVTDSEAVLLLLASRLAPVSGPGSLAAPWLCCDTDWHGTNTQLAWFNLCGIATYDLAHYRTYRPRHINDFCRALMLKRREPVTFVDSQQDSPSRYHHNVRQWQEMEQNMLRLRVVTPRDRFNSKADYDKLNRLAWQVTGTEFRQGPQVAEPELDRAWAHKLAALARLNPALRSWTDLTANFTALAWQLARLPVGPVATTLVLDRVIRDTVRPWTWQILTALGTDRIDSSLLAKRIGPMTKAQGYLYRSELMRLRRAKVLTYQKKVNWVSDVHALAIVGSVSESKKRRIA